MQPEAEFSFRKHKQTFMYNINNKLKKRKSSLNSLIFIKFIHHQVPMYSYLLKLA